MGESVFALGSVYPSDDDKPFNPKIAFPRDVEGINNGRF